MESFTHDKSQDYKLVSNKLGLNVSSPITTHRPTLAVHKHHMSILFLTD